MAHDSPDNSPVQEDYSRYLRSGFRVQGLEFNFKPQTPSFKLVLRLFPVSPRLRVTASYGLQSLCITALNGVSPASMELTAFKLKVAYLDSLARVDTSLKIR
jgi:hypothetical protein